MNAYEIEAVEKQIRGELRLPLSYYAWADIERQAREERAHAMGRAFKGFFAALGAKITGLGRLVRSTAAECTDARLRHN
jgi:hypothetical protein